jgi:peptide/nickel transport system substrate-binding protein
MRRSTFAVLVALLLVNASAALGSTVTVALNADIRSTNPGVNRDDNTDAVMRNIVEGLVAYKEDGAVGPLLAEKVDQSADGLTYTFHLRQGVVFHDGTPLTAVDVLWNWRRYMDPKTEWRCLSEFDGRNGLKVEEATAPDSGTFVMRLNRPSALFLDSLARTDCDMAVIARSSVNADGSWDKPVGTGPFMMGEWKKGEYIILKKFADYKSPPGDKEDGYTGHKAPLVDEVKFLVVPDGVAVKAALLAGDIDAALLLSSDVDELKASGKVEIRLEPDSVKHVILFQTRDPLLSNVKLRQAIAASLDLSQVVDASSNGLGKPNPSAIPLTSSYHDAAQSEGYNYDPEKAKALLAEAGYKGQKIVIQANRRATMPSNSSALVVQAMMQAAGINVDVQVLDWATQLDRYSSGNYQMQAFSYSSRMDPALSYEQFSGPKDKQPRKVWENPQALKMIDEASQISDPATRQKIFDALHRLQLQDTPLLVLFNGVEAWGSSKHIRGFSAFEGQPRLWNVERVN